VGVGVVVVCDFRRCRVAGGGGGGGGGGAAPRTPRRETADTVTCEDFT
jgi:hypothetical protein